MKEQITHIFLTSTSVRSTLKTKLSMQTVSQSFRLAFAFVKL